MARDDAHPFDEIADSLFSWMNEEVAYHVDALRGGHRAPFSAAVTEQDKTEYFRRQMFQTTPDGQVQYDKPNPEGRDKILKQYGTATYAQIWDTVKPKQGLRSPGPEPTEDPLETTMPQMPEDSAPVEGS